MAEQSMFWPTTGTGDGISGGYTSDRLGAIWDAAMNSGILSGMIVSGIGTSSLSIAAGSAMVSGYLYENTTSATIATSTLGSATYGLYIIANESASALTVNRSVAGTSVASKTVRLALNSTAPSQPYVRIADVTTVAGAITAIGYFFSPNRHASLNATSKMPNEALLLIQPAFGDSPISIPNNTVTRLTGGTFSTGGTFVDVDYTTGIFSVSQSGLYMVTAEVTWDTNTTNRRRININNTYNQQFSATSFIHTTMSKQTFSAPLQISAPDEIEVYVWQDSGATRTITALYVSVVKV